MITRNHPFSDSTDSLLRFAMRVDATLTGVLGLAIAVMADPLGRLTGLTAAQATSPVRRSCSADSSSTRWPHHPTFAGSAPAWSYSTPPAPSASSPSPRPGVLPLTTVGSIAALAGALYTATFAVLQYLGVRRLA